MIRLALIAGLSASSALKIPSRDAVDAAFRDPKSEVASYTYEPVALPAAALLDPFVDASRELTRFKTPYVKVTKTGGEETYRYDREPSSAEDALALLELDNLSYVLKYELLESLDEWPEALAALVPPNLIDTLTEDPYAGGTTVHAYLSAPGAVALPAHEDLGDVRCGVNFHRVDGVEARLESPFAHRCSSCNCSARRRGPSTAATTTSR